jgi:GTP cyclohydrolase II
VAVPGADCPAPLVRLHSACITGEVFGSTKCDCGPQLDAALELIQESGNGALLYLLRHEGRGIGLANKIRAYDLQASGHDTVAANQVLGLPVDARNFQIATAVLRSLGYTQVRLITNNPDKIHAVEDSGIQVLERVPFGGFTNADNIEYLAVKDTRLGHLDSLGTERPFDSGTPA